MAIVEMSELSKELTKFLRGNGNKEKIAEEIDVYIMMELLKLLFDGSGFNFSNMVLSK